MDRVKSPQPPRPVMQPPPRQKSSGILPWLIRLPLLGITAVLLLFFLAVLYVAMHQVQYDGLIYPGVSSYGVKLSGMTKPQAVEALGSRYTYGESAVFTFRDGEKSWQISARELGVSFDPAKTVEEAYQVGRGDALVSNLMSQADSWLNGYAIQPTVVFDQSKATSFLEKIAATLEQPVKDASIVLNGTDVSTSPSQIGRQLDLPATLGMLRPVVLNMGTGGEIPLVIRETQPTVKDADAVGAQVRAAVSSPLILYIDTGNPKDPGPWQVSPDFIAGMISIIRTDDGDGSAHYEVKATVEPLRSVIQGLSDQLTVSPQNAKFLFNDTTHQLELISDSINGRSLDVDSTLKLIQESVFRSDSRRVPLVFHLDIPKVNSHSTAAELGITEKVVEATTFFYGSTPERRVNIQVAAARFHGLVIAPGEVFSFNKYLGDVSPETGYETGLVIFGNQTIAGVGGGVCQVSSTVFQAAFFGGFPIKERYAHGYRVGYYESGAAFAGGQKYNTGVGLDATVYSPIIDFKFINDTPYYLLMTSTFNPSAQSLTIRYYSTGTGRVVTKDGPTLGAVVSHGPTKYQESQDMKPGQQKQVDFAVDGVDVHVYRTITQNGQVITDREDIYSHYLPWSNIVLVAPGYGPKTNSN